MRSASSGPFRSIDLKTSAQAVAEFAFAAPLKDLSNLDW